jgi:superfamily II DNA or RNA helicase
MSDIVKANKVSESQLRLECDDSGILRELSEYYTYFAEGYRFMPKFRNGLWDGKLRLWNLQTKILPFGLLSHLAEFCRARDYVLELGPGVLNTTTPTVEALREFAKSLMITRKDTILTPHDYQIEAFIHAIRSRRTVLVSPTASGKSLIIYLLLRWFIEHESHGDEKILIVVPTTSLVEQMQSDFADYSQQDDDFNANEDVHKIYSGKEKNRFESRVVVTTWQSAIKMPPVWFNQYAMVIGDEAHQFKAISLTTIMNNLSRARFRIGTTGTLDNTKVHELVLTGSFGNVHRVISTKELMEAGSLAQLKINCMVLKHEEENRKIVSKLEYKKEIDYLASCVARNRFIRNLALGLKGNTLILFNLVHKHGRPLHKLIKEHCGSNRKVFYVSGSVGVDERESIRALTERESDAIIVASIGTFATGINIRNLHNIVFASPTKSQIRVLQSIGRGLRLSDNGQSTTVYDISDNLCWKSKKNFTYKHALDRLKIYTAEKFNYKIYELDLLL